MPDSTLSGIGSPLDPSGSSPQPSPLSGLPLSQLLFGGGGQDAGMAGIGGGPGGGQQAGPSLDILSLMNQLTGLEGAFSNQASLFAPIGGNITPSSVGQQIGGQQPTFGVAGGFSQGQVPIASAGAGASGAAGGGGQQGASGSANPLGLIAQALGRTGNSLPDLINSLTPNSRGDTGGVSLSDQLRGIDNSSAGGFVGPLNPDLFGGVAVSPGDVSAPISLDQLLQLSGSPDVTGGSALPAAIGAQFAGSGGGDISASLSAALANNAASGAAEGLPAAAGEAGAEAGLGAGLGGLTAGLLPIIMAFFGQGILGTGSGAEQMASQLQDTKSVRNAFSQAAPVLKQAPDTLNWLENINNAPADQQIPELQNIAQNAFDQWSQGPAVSAFLASQGGRQSFIPALDVSSAQTGSNRDFVDSLLAYTGATDQLQQRGVGLGNIPDLYQNPQDLVNFLGTEGGINFSQMPTAYNAADPGNPIGQYYLSDQDLADFAPGNRLGGIETFLKQFNPNLQQSLIGQALQGMGAWT